MSQSASTSSQTILRNSIWYGLETVIELLVFTSSSIAVARYLGPDKLGHFTYINFFVSILTRTAGQGVTSATRKYMTEFLVQGRPGVARAVYHLAAKYQLFTALAISTVSILLVALFGEHSYRLMASILLASIVPGLMSWVPAQANTAFQDLRPNTISAFGYLISYAVIITLTIVFRWDLVGVASATLVGRTVEVLLRIGPVHRRLREMPVEALDPELVARIRRFSWQGIWLQLLTTVVWDRSELIFLRYFSTYEQTAFYSVSFTFTNSVLTAARVFATTSSITLMAEASRSYEKVRSLTAGSCRFLLLLTVPVSLGGAAVTYAGIHLTYGGRYLPAVPVLITAVLLGIPRAFQVLPETLLRAADMQKTILTWYSITGIVNILADWYFITRYAAVGAAWGNGLAQAFGVVAIWLAADRVFQLRFPWLSAVRIGAASLAMAALPYFLSHRFPGWLGLGAAILSGLVTYPLMLRIFRAVGPEDRGHLETISRRLPAALGPSLDRLIGFITPSSV